MEAIKTYLETMFGTLPQTAEAMRMKNDLLISMEEKYNELKAEGKSENEAIGTVISEFGNIDELAQELGVDAPKLNSNAIVVDLAEAKEYLSEGRRVARKTALGVMFIIIGVAILIGFLGLGNLVASENTPLIVDGEQSSFAVRMNEIGEKIKDSLDSSEVGYLAAGMVFLIVFVAIGVGILAPVWIRFSKYNYTDLKKEISLPEHVRQYVEKYKNDFSNEKVTLIVTGAIICILSTLAVILPALLELEDFVLFGTSAFLIMASVGVMMLVRMGITDMSINSLLRPEEYIREHRTETKVEKIVGTAAAFYWPLVVAVYLLVSFGWDSWNRSWIIWPVAGLVFGAFAGAVGAYHSISDDKK